MYHEYLKNLLEWFCFFKVQKDYSDHSDSDHSDLSDYFFFDEESGNIESL